MKRIFWKSKTFGTFEIGTGLVVKESPKTYTVEKASDYRSRIWKSEVVENTDQFFEDYLKNVARRVEIAKGNFIEAKQRVKYLKKLVLTEKPTNE